MDLSKSVEFKGDPHGLIYPMMHPYPDTDLVMALQQLPSAVFDRSESRYVFAHWDLDAAWDVAHKAGFAVKNDPWLDGHVAAWLRHRLDMELLLAMGHDLPFDVPGLLRELWPHQKVGAQYMLKGCKILVGDQMGVGKTPQTIAAWMKARHDAGGRLKALVVCPATNVDATWRRRFEEWTGVQVAVAQGGPAERRALYKYDNEVLVVSYNLFARDLDLILEGHRAGFFATDEAQFIVSHSAKTTKAVHRYCDEVKPAYVFPITGTPISNWPDDLWALSYMLNPILAGTQKRFLARYVKMVPVYSKKGSPDGKPRPLKIKRFHVMRVDKYIRIDELRERMRPWTLRRLKSDVLKDLPEKSVEKMEVVLSEHERKAYEKAKADHMGKEALAEIAVAIGDDNPLSEKESDSILTLLMRLQQIVDSLLIFNGDDHPSTKLERLKRFIKDNANEHKIVVFSRFREMTTLIEKELGRLRLDHKHGFTSGKIDKEGHLVDDSDCLFPLHLHGGVPQKDRDALMQAFQNQGHHRVFVSTLKAGGAGIDLFAADIVIFYDLWWSPAANSQAEDRLHRPGQKNPVTVIQMVVKDSIEERVLEVLEKKKDIIGSIFREEDVIRSLPRSLFKGIL